jgi:hypothetical protein
LLGTISLKISSHFKKPPCSYMRSSLSVKTFLAP